MLALVGFLVFVFLQPPGGQPEIELTKTDLLSVKDWDSMQVRVCGLRLGMSRAEANSTVRREGLKCRQEGADSCLADDSQGNYTGMQARFGKAGEIIEIAIEPPPDAEYLVTKAAVTRRFKGQTFQLFQGEYSNVLRLKLLGPETKQETFDGRFGDKLKDTRYVYPKRGFTITVSPGGVSLPKLELLGVSFYPPAVPQQ